MPNSREISNLSIKLLLNNILHVIYIVYGCIKIANTFVQDEQKYIVLMFDCPGSMSTSEGE